MKKLVLMLGVLAITLTAATPALTQATGSGPTVAPDLTSVDSFRRAPVNASGNPRTCVDFVFDQQAFLTGGDRSNFHLAPVNGDDAVDGTSVTVDSGQCVDTEGDDTITVVFNGRLAPKDYARGYVDRNTVSSGSQGNEPTNVGQAADISPNPSTVNPDLLSVSTRCSQKQAFFRFDEPLDQEDVVQDTAGLRVYFEDTTVAASQAVRKTDSQRTLRAVFSDLPEGKSLQDAVGALVTEGTVVGGREPGGPGGENGNAFDEVAPINRGNVIRGTKDGETLNGTEGRDIICGLGGDDTINAGGGNDYIGGGFGNDQIFGENGRDTIIGSVGQDTLIGNAGIDTIRGNGGDDTIKGGKDDDRLFGDDGDDTLIGNLGVDRAFGEDDKDTLKMKDGTGNELVNGGAGNSDTCRADSNDNLQNCP